MRLLPAGKRGDLTAFLAPYDGQEAKRLCLALVFVADCLADRPVNIGPFRFFEMLPDALR